MVKDNLVAILEVIAGLCFIISAIISKKYIHIIIGICFIILGISYIKRKKMKKR